MMRLKFGTNAVRHKGNKESKTIPLLAHIQITFKVTDKDQFQDHYHSICLPRISSYLLRKLILSAKPIKTLCISALQILMSFQKHERKWRNTCFLKNFLNTSANKCHLFLSSGKFSLINERSRSETNMNKKLGFHTDFTNIFSRESNILHTFIPKRTLTNFYFLMI